MNIQEALARAAPRLKPRRIACAEEQNLGRLEAELLLAALLKKDRAWLASHADSRLTTRETRGFEALVRRRLRHEPMAYITHEKEFYGRSFFVNPSVLIPRPETELLAELALAARGEIVWDVGTGCGALAISIALARQSAEVLATDVDTRALLVARRNAKRHHVTNVTFLAASLLERRVRSWLEERGAMRHAPAKRLVIVANLPYLPLSDAKLIARDVRDFEPHRALFAGRRGTEVIETFLRQLSAFDLHEMRTFLEFDSPQSQQLRAFAKQLFPHATVRVHRDLARRDRVLEISRSSDAASTPPESPRQAPSTSQGYPRTRVQ